MTLEFEPTPFAAPAVPPLTEDRQPAGLDPALQPAFQASHAGGANLERLLTGARCVTTGQQPGLFTGPLFTIYKAISAVVLARALEQQRGEPVVPVFWVAGDDHDFAEANHTHLLNREGAVERLELRARPAEAPLTPLYREPVGKEIEPLLERIESVTPESEFRPAVLEWLRTYYRPDETLASAFAGALAALLGPLGLVVFQGSHPAVKRAMAPFMERALDGAEDLQRSLAARASELSSRGLPVPVTVGDSATTVMLEGRLGRDRLLADDGRYTTRRAGETWSRQELHALLRAEPDRFSPNVLLRPVMEAAILPTLAYVAGPGEMAYLRQTAPLYAALDITPQLPFPRWSGRVVESRIRRILDKYGVPAGRLAPDANGLEQALAREELPSEARTALAALRNALGAEYGRLVDAATGIDPTLRKPVESARNSALVGVGDIEKRLVSHLKRQNDIVSGQLARARAGIFPLGQPQERVLGVVSFLVRYGPDFIDSARDAIEAWVRNLEPATEAP